MKANTHMGSAEQLVDKVLDEDVRIGDYLVFTDSVEVRIEEVVNIFENDFITKKRKEGEETYDIPGMGIIGKRYGRDYYRSFPWLRRKVKYWDHVDNELSLSFSIVEGIETGRGVGSIFKEFFDQP